jgi:hypothetical protein
MNAITDQEGYEMLPPEDREPLQYELIWYACEVPEGTSYCRRPSEKMSLWDARQRCEQMREQDSNGPGRSFLPFRIKPEPRRRGNGKTRGGKGAGRYARS